MQKVLIHLLMLLIMTICGTGCQQSNSNELGTIVTDLSQVPGTETPYQLPDLGGDEPSANGQSPTADNSPGDAHHGHSHPHP